MCTTCRIMKKRMQIYRLFSNRLLTGIFWILHYRKYSIKINVICCFSSLMWLLENVKLPMELAFVAHIIFSMASTGSSIKAGKTK